MHGGWQFTAGVHGCFGLLMDRKCQALAINVKGIAVEGDALVGRAACLRRLGLHVTHGGQKAHKVALGGKALHGHGVVRLPVAGGAAADIALAIFDFDRGAALRL